MTSASELFHCRRSRASRTPDAGFDCLFPEPDRDRDRDRDHHHYHRNPRRQYRHRLHHDDCDPSRRSSPHGGPPHANRHLCHRVSQTERESVRIDLSGTSDPSTGNSGNRDTSSSRITGLRFTRNDRLPGAVLQARARLVERLRGVSLAGNRQNTSNPGISWDEFAVGDDFRAIDSGDWETETPSEWFESGSSFIDSTTQSEQPSSFQDLGKKPPGLTQEAINSLRREAFKDEGESSGVLRASLECCICLEKFCGGDGLIRLPCGHRFHPPCLDPWVRTCGDCPYCRTRIVIELGEEEGLVL